MQYGILPRLLAALVICSAASSAARAAEPSDQVIDSLQTALAKGASHARDSLDQKDFKSLAQSAGSLHLLAELMQARSDAPTWQAAAGKIVSATSDIQAAAKRRERGEMHGGSRMPSTKHRRRGSYKASRLSRKHCPKPPPSAR